MKKSPKLRQRNSVPLKRMKLSDPVAETPTAKRILSVVGTDDYAVLKTFQQHFGAKLVHYQDEAGEVGTKPRWAE
jgi:hypothetical protein